MATLPQPHKSTWSMLGGEKLMNQPKESWAFIATVWKTSTKLYEEEQIRHGFHSKGDLMERSMTLTSAASLCRRSAAPADFGAWLRFWESRSPWAVPRFARTVYRWKVLCKRTCFLEHKIHCAGRFTSLWIDCVVVLLISAIMCNMKAYKAGK